MSKQLSLLQIEPHQLGWENKPEVIHVIAECPMCKGEGSLKSPKGYHGSAKDELIITECMRCRGSRRLRADVIIRWTPDRDEDDTDQY